MIDISRPSHGSQPAGVNGNANSATCPMTGTAAGAGPGAPSADFLRAVLREAGFADDLDFADFLVFADFIGWPPQSQPVREWKCNHTAGAEIRAKARLQKRSASLKSP